MTPPRFVFVYLASILLYLLSAAAEPNAATVPQNNNRAATGDTVTLALYVDGALKNVPQDDDSGSTATGSLRLNFRKPSGIYDASIAIASDEDSKTLTAGFGASVLAMSGNRSGYLEGYHFRWHDTEKFGAFDGWSWKVGTAVSDWIVPGAPDSPQTAVVLGGEIGYVNDMMNIYDPDHISLFVDIRAALRYLDGDVSKDERRATLGSDKNLYLGPAIGLTLQFNTITASADVYWMFGSGSDRVDGLSGLQAVISMTVSAPTLQRKAKLVKKTAGERADQDKN